MDMQTHCIALANALNAKFTIRGNPVEYSRVFSDVGLLPGIARRADRICSLCFGYGIGVKFEDEERSMLGVKVIFDDITPVILRLLCIADVLSEIIQTSTKKGLTSLDELIYD